MLEEIVRDRLRGPGPHLVGVGGPVAVGKTTIALALAGALGGRVVTTDAFLFPNAILGARGLSMRKGFPETYDHDALEHVVASVRAGESVNIPVYSHVTYDIVEGASDVVEASGVVVVEGIIATQKPLVDRLDVAVYVDADEAVVRAWFVDRLLGLLAAAPDDPASFYAPFAGLSSGQKLSFAEMAWDSINAVNLAEHIGPSKVHASIIVEKMADHSIRRIVAV